MIIQNKPTTITYDTLSNLKRFSPDDNLSKYSLQAILAFPPLLCRPSVTTLQVGDNICICFFDSSLFLSSS